MGTYINPGNDGFKNILNSDYIDKTGIIAQINKTLNSSRKLTCITRPRRFGKSFAEKTLCAYYDCTCDSAALFEGLEATSSTDFNENLNKYNVLFVDITGFYQNKTDDIIKTIIDSLSVDLKKEFNFCNSLNSINDMLLAIVENTGKKIIFIIDEWDAIFREEKDNVEAQKEYISLLRGFFKNGNITDKVFAGAYMTGILPIKKYGTQSAVSDFKEYTMLEPGPFARYFGFTDAEVHQICDSNEMNYNEMKKWYDGYYFTNFGEIYNPNSVMEATHLHKYKSYWADSETYESLRKYISMNLDGLKDCIRDLIGGSSQKVNVSKFQNDMVNISTKDDVLTLLVHLGYLTYNDEKEVVSIPNQEIIGEFINAIEDGGWQNVIEAITASDKLLDATLNMNASVVADMIEKVHEDNTSIVQYNDENSLSCIITIAYYSARKKYTIIRELPSGKGFADIAFIPLNINDSPFIIELKWDKDADTAINQIKAKRYNGALSSYNEIIAAGINYNKKNKKHEAVIEKIKI